jgi:AraC-like DNA-binding protein
MLTGSTLAAGGVPVWKALKSYGIDPATLFEKAGVDPAKLDVTGARYGRSDMRRLWRMAAEASGDPCFGLTAGQHWHPSSFHALGYAWLASETLYDAFNRLVRYFSVLTGGTLVIFKVEAEECRLDLRPMGDREPMPPVIMDAFFSTVINMCRASYGDSFSPLRVEFQRAEPPCAAKFSSFFCSPVVFGTESNGLVMSLADLTKLLPTANLELARASEQVVSDYLSQFKRADIVDRAKAQLVEQLPSGNPTQETLASSLDLSVRTLQRKLHDRDTSFTKVLENTRRELASEYMHKRSMSNKEIAYLLGFSEPSNFSRAFKRWTGLSPSEFRASA